MEESGHVGGRGGSRILPGAWALDDAGGDLLGGLRRQAEITEPLEAAEPRQRGGARGGIARLDGGSEARQRLGRHVPVEAQRGREADGVQRPCETP